MESRLKKSKARMSMGGAPSGFDFNDPATATPAGQQAEHETQQAPAAAGKDADTSKARSRPGTARAAQQAPSSGNMPPTPGGSEGEYYLVTKEDLDDAPR